MFQRGQKIVVLKSSARSGTRPRAGDVGYLDNLYLFPRFRFILLDAFFFAYDGDNRDRVEKKKFMIDLGMCRDMRFKISHKGIPVKFFINNVDLVNLSSVGYRIRTPSKGNQLFISYPQIYSNYGIWPRLKKRLEANLVEDRIVKIPYGQIALFNTKFTHKYSMVECGEVELTAWLRSMIPMVGSALSVLCDYSYFYPLDPMENENGYFDLARNMWSGVFSRMMSFDFPPTDAARYSDAQDSISAYRFERFSSNRSQYKKDTKLLVENINRLSSLTSIFLQRLDSYHLNGYLNPEADRTADFLSSMWKSCGIIDGADISFTSGPHLYDLIRSVFFRAAIMPNNTYARLKTLAHCLPEEWQKDDELNCRIKILDGIKAAADSDSSALDRIYEVIK